MRRRPATADDLHAALHDNVATKADLAELKHDLTLRGIAALISSLGILFAALQHWPPH
jgi:hypothetical protein